MNIKTVTTDDLLSWLDEQISKAQYALKCRQDSALVWKQGTDEEWAESALLHPQTSKVKRMSKSQRLEQSNIQSRIADKCSREILMFKSLKNRLFSDTEFLGDCKNPNR